MYLLEPHHFTERVSKINACNDVVICGFISITVPSILTGGSGEEKEIAIDKVKLLMIGTRSGEQTSL